jgi:WD40 repeat protein
LTPDQRHLLLIVDDLTIWILDAHTGATQQKDTGIADSSKGLGATIVDALHCVSDLVPNSRVLTLGLLGSHDEAFVMTWDISDSGSGWYAEVPGGMIDDVKVSPDSSLVACGCSDGNTRILELGSGRVATTLNGNGTPITALSWASRDGVLLTGDKHGLLTLWNVRSSQRLAVHEGYPTLSVLSSISPDGRFAYGTRSGHVGIMTITDINADPPVSTGARP